MRRTVLLGVLALAGLLPGAAARADVIVGGPFGRMIIVPSPTEVRVGPGVYVAPAPPPPIVVVQPAPVYVQPLPPAPVPVVVAATDPRDFARTFKPLPGSYNVTFLHPISGKAVPVAFTLPPGQPRVLYIGNALIFDYGAQEVEIRFKIGGKVVVNNR